MSCNNYNKATISRHFGIGEMIDMYMNGTELNPHKNKSVDSLTHTPRKFE